MNPLVCYLVKTTTIPMVDAASFYNLLDWCMESFARSSFEATGLDLFSSWIRRASTTWVHQLHYGILFESSLGRVGETHQLSYAGKYLL